VNNDIKPDGIMGDDPMSNELDAAIERAFELERGIMGNMPMFTASNDEPRVARIKTDDGYNTGSIYTRISANVYSNIKSYFMNTWVGDQKIVTIEGWANIPFMFLKTTSNKGRVRFYCMKLPE